MVFLDPMSADVFDDYLRVAISEYAEENVQAGRWQPERAIERSENDFAKLLPQGATTPEHFLFVIKERQSGTPVGFIWFGIVENHGTRTAFIFDLKIYKDFRRRGFAKMAFAEVERRAQEMGIAAIGLHVFAFNTSAKALYTQLGFKVTGHNMTKKIAPDGLFPGIRCPVRARHYPVPGQGTCAGTGSPAGCSMGEAP